MCRRLRQREQKIHKKRCFRGHQLDQSVDNFLTIDNQLFLLQPGFGYQQQIVPGMRPAGGPMPNFFVPLVQQGSQQQAQRPVGRRGGQGPGQLMQQPLHFLPHQVGLSWYFLETIQSFLFLSML